MRTELVWEGKYDDYGRRREVNVAELSMPMQRIETVDEPRSRAEAEGQLPLWERQKHKVREQEGAYVGWRNRLIWGDNKLVIASLIAELKGCVDLIYIDPPFDVGADFTMDVPIGNSSDTVLKEQSTMEMVAYRDIWGKGTDSYLHMMFERLFLMKQLLSERGSIYVHCDWRMSPYIRILMNEVFGRENFRNEIYWYYYNKMHDLRKPIFPRATDSILFYARAASANTTFNRLREERESSVRQLVRKKVNGKMVNARDEQGNVLYREATDRTIDNVWRIPMLQPADKTQYLGYVTQKPEAILERIITASSNEGDLIADFFCGSGTTAAVAERLNRRWIAADLGRYSVHTCRKRLIELQRVLHAEGRPYRAFNVFNLGRYERQWWQKERLHGAEQEHRRVVLEFFKAELLASAPSPLLHARKAGAFCHVDGIDSVFSRHDARAVAEAVVAAGGREAYCLAWEFEMELRQHCLALEAELGVKLKLIPIPREIMEKNRKSPPPFLEMAVLEAEPVLRKTGSTSVVEVKLTKFLPSLAEVPSKELEALKERAVKSGFDFIDFWAVDFDWQPGQPFHHNWQDYRTRKDRNLRTVSDAGHSYAAPGKHTICVKVVDVFGCDTSITLPVEV
jgi:adenine-specific DNA-methyltransferase